jgi:proline iminopeptidase
MNKSISFVKQMKALCIFLSILASSPSLGCAHISAISTPCPQLKEVFIEANGARLFCQVTGRGEPIIVIHGGPGLSQDYLLPNMAKLGEHNLVIFYDQRACGRSTGKLNSESINLEKFLEDIESIRMAFGNKKITILGHSWGGFLAMQYTLKYPLSVERLILVNSIPASSEESTLCVKEWVSRMIPYQEEINGIEESPAFAAGDPDITEKWLKRMFCLYFYDPDKAELLNWRMSPRAFIDGRKVDKTLSMKLLTSYNLHESLTKLKIPTLIIHGESDPIFASTAQKTHESIIDSSCIIIPKCGHFPYVEAPKEFFHHLSVFLQESKK